MNLKMQKSSKAKKYIATVIALVLCASACSCAKADPPQNTAPEQDSGTTVTDQVSTPDNQIHKYCVIDSTTGDWLYLPFHRAENVPEDFIASVANNPIDSDWDALSESVEGDYALLRPHLEEYSALWDAETQKAVDDLCEALGEDYRQTVTQYVEARRSFVDAFYWDLIDAIGAGGFIGTYTSYAIAQLQLDEQRQTVFYLKYLRYVWEVATDDSTGASKTYLHSGTAPSATKELWVITATDGLPVRTFASPSLTSKSGDDYASAMADNPIDQNPENTVQAWRDELSCAVSFLNNTTSCTDAQALYDKYADMAKQEKGMLDALSALQCIPAETDFDYRAERRIVLYLKYLGYVYETQFQDECNNVSLSFAANQNKDR